MTVVVVGGGIVGASSAFHLAERGERVVLCEAGALGQGSTARSVGGIRTQFSTRVNVDLSLASLETWESFEERFGVDIGFRQNGYLFLAREADTAAAFERDVAMQRERGAPSRLLSPAEARERCPELREESFRAATFAPCDGYADPYLAVQGFVEAARDAGADVRTKTAVTDVAFDDAAGGDGGATVTVSGPDGDEEIAASHVVNAAGAWAARVGELAGVELPVSPRRRQVLVADPETPLPDDLPLTIDLDTGSYFRPDGGGVALVGGRFGEADPVQDPDAYRERVDLDWAATATERAADCAGYFGPETRIERGWAGLYAVTPDHHPIVEEVRPGFVVAAGFSGHGFQHAPATGRLVAELVRDGEASLLDVDPLRLDRFERGETRSERNVA